MDATLGFAPRQKKMLAVLPRMSREASLEIPGLRLRVRRRPAYCDRGEFEVHADGLGDWPPVGQRVHIDGADHFPRLYFGLDAMLSEVEAFLRKRKLWDDANPPRWKEVAEDA